MVINIKRKRIAPTEAENFNRLFDKSELKRKSIRGGGFTFISQGSIFALQLISTYFLARILAPSDFGILGMVLSISKFANLFQELGLSAATIQHEKITAQQVSNLFWINTFVGLILSLFFILLAPFVAHFYNEPKLTLITIVLSSTFLFSGLGVQHQALLSRSMKFGRLAFAQVGSYFISVVSAIFLAKVLKSYWALVWMNLLNTFLYSLFLSILSPWVPNYPQKRAGIRSMLMFGKDVSLFNVVNYFARNFDNILIGRLYGAVSLGFYEKAYQLLMLPINQIRLPLFRVAMPALSSLQHDSEKYQNYFLRMLYIIAFVSMPMVVYLGVYADNLVFLLLGPKWNESAQIFSILVFAAFIQPIATTRGLVLITSGKSKQYVYWGIINSSLTVVSFIVGLNWGVLGVATSYSIYNYLIFIPSLKYCFKDSPIQLKKYFSSIINPLILSLVTGLIVFVFKLKIPINSNLLELIVGFIVYSGSYLLIYFLLSYKKFSNILIYKK